ncbi:hypothetical protein KCU89_g700, partial [Aureobasidium melanogenum]
MQPHHFCYVCGASWNPRTCTCPQWDEARLQERAEQIFARDPRHRLFRPPEGALDPGVDAAAAVPPAIPQEVVGPAQPANPARARTNHGRELGAEANIPARPVAAAHVDLQLARVVTADWLAREIERRIAQNGIVAPADIERARVAYADIARQIEHLRAQDAHINPADIVRDAEVARQLALIARLRAQNAPAARPAAQIDPVVAVAAIRPDYITPEARRPAIPGAAVIPNAAARPAAQDAAAIRQQHLVAEIREDLRRNHECDHERWTRHDGRHRCEECNDMLPYYIFECRQCHIRACLRCRRNRL